MAKSMCKCLLKNRTLHKIISPFIKYNVNILYLWKGWLIMCKNNTCLISVVISIIIAIALAIAFFVGVLPGILAVVVSALILAVVAVLSIILVNGYRDNRCLCDNGICLIVGIAGTILFGIVSLAVTLTVGAILPTVLIALLGFFAGLTLTNLIALLICVAKSSCGHKECN